MTNGVSARAFFLLDFSTNFTFVLQHAKGLSPPRPEAKLVRALKEIMRLREFRGLASKLYFGGLAPQNP